MRPRGGGGRRLLEAVGGCWRLRFPPEALGCPGTDFRAILARFSNDFRTIFGRILDDFRPILRILCILRVLRILRVLCNLRILSDNVLAPKQLLG